MYLNEILNNNQPIDGQPAIDVARKIKVNCIPFIIEMKGIPAPDNAIYRGLPRQWPDYTFSTNPSRRPIGMVYRVQSKLDDFFQMEFGHKYRSENVVFGVGDVSHSAEFGKPHVLFPVGKFSYLWSPEIDDINYELYHRNVDEIIASANFYHNKGLDQVKLHEVMINVKQYYAIPLIIYKRSVYPLLLQKGAL